MGSSGEIETDCGGESLNISNRLLETGNWTPVASRKCDG